MGRPSRWSSANTSLVFTVLIQPFSLLNVQPITFTEYSTEVEICVTVLA